MVEQVRSGQAMIAGMEPVLDAADYVFCTSRDLAVVEAALASALGSFAEQEGLSLILPVEVARSLGLHYDGVMRRIVLTVYSALEGVGLTTAVAGKLAEAGIACNMVAAFHHDHVFVPAAEAERAMGLLRELQAEARV
jgi:hypothetical protein